MEVDMCSTSIISLNFDLCQVCGQAAHGKHFGAITCRACAAFFRRSAKVSKSVYKCHRNDKCEVLRNGRFACKKCKLKKCVLVGMDSNRFVFGRDLISAMESFRGRAKKLNYTDDLPETIEHISGRPLFVIYMDAEQFYQSEKSYINLQYLIDEGAKVLELGSETPLFAKNSLQKLAIGLRTVRDKSYTNQSVGFQKLHKIGKEQAISFWEKDFLAVARWLTYFDDFQKLPREMQITLLKTIWHIWTRLEKLSLTAVSRRNNLCHNNEMMLHKNSSYNQKEVEMDISWITKFPKEKLKFLFDEPQNWIDLATLDPLMELQPTDVELSYMMCQLSFHYAGKRHQGEILEVTDRFQDRLANDLHEYYVNELRISRYSGRLNQMMRINNRIQEDIRAKRVKRELADIFSIYCAEFSHPEMFKDT
ncbi:hypothetical protein GCK72_019543 [Caenorhabditis remanei]|uniref:Uncharacterized protein n=1 Tax=Caenorhabditis remanei TaxID=31234 RepID=A0A6A5GCW6_CAERE|nr:hypothetical protein GCK72_019543 [Caenorhabditis remanei]KAF1752988.1 hypothetical protein GCK72_019543 [Caenorhabditis remanei]